MTRMSATHAYIMLFIALTALMPLLAFNIAQAKNTPQNMQTQIQTNAKTLETLLNVQNDPEQLLSFLDNIVSNQAEIHLTINNDAHNLEPAKVKLTKADYINSYLYGPKQVEDYKAKIQTQIMHVDYDAKILVSKEALLETGTMKTAPAQKTQGDAFKTLTICESHYKISTEKHLKLETSTCEVNINIEESV